MLQVRNWIQKSVAKPFFLPAISLLLGAAMALSLPAYSGPDESAHVVYIKSLSHAELPEMPQGDIVDARTHTTYQAHHPPLYYLLGVPFYLLAGRSEIVGLYALRLFGVVLLALSVVLVRMLSERLLPEKGRIIPPLLVALHPTIVYLSSMVNNESLAITLSLACVLAAVQSQTADRPIRWWILAAVLGGLCLLTKFTAIAGVVAAGAAAARYRNSWKWPPLIIIIAGALAIWLPWGMFMLQQYGAVAPSSIHRPAFTGGWGALLLYPDVVLNLSSIILMGLVAGILFLPHWLMQSPMMYFFLADDEFCGPTCLMHCYALLIMGWLLAGWLTWRAAASENLKFLIPSFWLTFLLIAVHVFIHNAGHIYFSARSSPALAALLTLLLANEYMRMKKASQNVLIASWCLLVLFGNFYIFHFFLS